MAQAVGIDLGTTDSAIAVVEGGKPTASIVEGVRGVRDQALAVLAGLRFPRRDDAGTRFDPTRHEALAAVPAPYVPTGTVLQALRPTYRDGQPQLRPPR